MNETPTSDRVDQVVRDAMRDRLTGSVTLHFADGQLKLVEEKRSWRPEPPLDKGVTAAIR